jgi:hypothetical protein
MTLRVPTVLPTDSAELRPNPNATGTVHCTVVAETQELDRQTPAGCKRLVGDGLNDAKFRPVMVATLIPDAGLLVTEWYVTTGASYVNPALYVPTTPEIDIDSWIPVDALGIVDCPA